METSEVRLKRRVKEIRKIHETNPLIRLDWRTRLTFWVADLLDAIERGKKLHQARRRAREGWWTRNGERFWNILEAIAKLITRLV